MKMELHQYKQMLYQLLNHLKLMNNIHQDQTASKDKQISPFNKICSQIHNKENQLILPKNFSVMKILQKKVKHT